MSVSHIFHLCKPALVRHCRHVPEFVGGRRGAAEPVEAAVSAGLGDGCSGLGHLEDGPELPAALHQTSPSAHAALAYKACQVQTIKNLERGTFDTGDFFDCTSFKKGGLCFIHSNLPEDCDIYLFLCSRIMDAKIIEIAVANYTPITITGHLGTYCSLLLTFFVMMVIKKQLFCFL